jgi:phage terminase small subunit
MWSRRWGLALDPAERALILEVMASSSAVPKHLSARSRRIWRTISLDFDFSAEPHAAAILTLGCEAIDRADQARQVLARDGLTYTNARGEPRPRPEVGIERDSAIRAARLFRELSLDVPEDDSRPPRAGTGALS